MVIQKHDRVDEVFSTDEKIQQLQNSTENVPAKDILSSGASCFGSTGVSKQYEGLISEKPLFIMFDNY